MEQDHPKDPNENQEKKNVNPPPEHTPPAFEQGQEGFSPQPPPVPRPQRPFPSVDLTPVHHVSQRVRQELSKLIVGQHEYLDLLLTGLFVGGHVLVEGVPGIAKTLIAKMMAQAFDLNFSRIQFTPDLMPADVIGTTVFDMKQSEFRVTHGPVFANIVLIDEINRSPAKTQAALFEVMEEQQVTMDGATYRMDRPFFVIATQNPIEQEGTYRLPEAQLDRFLFKINLTYPELEDEKAILRRFRRDFDINIQQEVKQVCTISDILECQRLVQQVYIKDELLDYIAEMIVSTRNHGDLYLGASPRASLSMMKASKAVAAMNGRDFVTPDDIQFVAYPVLNHRIILTPEREMEGFHTEDVIRGIIEKQEVPR